MPAPIYARWQVFRSFSGAKTGAGKADEAAGLSPGNEDNAASICFSPEKPYFHLSIDGIYVEILTPKIEANVLARYGVETASTRASTSYTLRNGGAIGYHGISDAVVLDTFYTAEQYRIYQNAHIDVADGVKSFSISKLLSYLSKKLGLVKDYAEAISGWGLVFGILSNLNSWYTSSAQKSVNNADGYAEIINVSAAGGTEQGSTIIGWKNYPIAVIPDIATDIHVQRYS